MTRTINAPVALGAPLPGRIQNAPFGSTNVAAGARAVPRPIIAQPGPAFALAQTDDRQVNELQQNARRAGAQARANPMANGRLLEGIVLVNGTTTISHGLGRPIRGMIMCAMSAEALWAFSKGLTPAQNFVISANSGTTVDIWVYA